MKVLALTRYDEAGASSRYRVYQYVPGLRALGIDVEVSPLLGDGYVSSLYAGRRAGPFSMVASVLSRCRALLRSRSYDLVWLEKELFPFFPPGFEQLLNSRGVPFVVDYDDAIFHNYDQHRSSLVRHALGDKIDRVMAAASLVVAGNDYLATRAREAGAAAVAIIPTTIDLDRYPRSQPGPEKFSKNQLVVGWIGSPSTEEYLRSICPALAAFCAESGARVKVIGARHTFRLPGVPLQLVDWQEETEVAELSRMDIGLMPLVDDAWSRGKCGLKLIQYMGCHRPVVASPVGVNSEIVQEGVTGFFAERSVDWLPALRRLASDAPLRAQMGSAGHRRVQERYSLQSALPKLAVLLRSAARPPLHAGAT